MTSGIFFGSNESLEIVISILFSRLNYEVEIKVFA